MCVIVRFLEVFVQGLWGYAPFLSGWDVKAEYVAEAWRRGVEEGFNTVHQLAEAQTDLATVRDAMEATDEALARKEQEAAYMVDGEM